MKRGHAVTGNPTQDFKEIVPHITKRIGERRRINLDRLTPRLETEFLELRMSRFKVVPFRGPVRLLACELEIVLGINKQFLYEAAEKFPRSAVNSLTCSRSHDIALSE